jgi:hypothetical protein
MMRSRLKQFIRKLLAPTGLTRRPPAHVTWSDGASHCGERWFDGDRYRTIIHNGLCVAAHFVDAGDLVVATLMVVNGSDRNVPVDPRLSLLAIWPDEDIAQEPLERLRAHASRPPEMLEAKRLAPKDCVAGELHFRRKAFEVAYFAVLIEHVFFEFVITPEQSPGAIERRTSCSA